MMTEVSFFFIKFSFKTIMVVHLPEDRSSVRFLGSRLNFMFRLLKSDWTSCLQPASAYYNHILLSNVFYYTITGSNQMNEMLCFVRFAEEQLKILSL